MVTLQREALFRPLIGARPVLKGWNGLPLFWRLLGVNLVVVLGGALIGTWLTQRLVLSGTFTPITHGLLVLGALCLSAGLTMLLLRETFRPIRSLREGEASVSRSETPTYGQPGAILDFLGGA